MANRGRDYDRNRNNDFDDDFDDSAPPPRNDRTRRDVPPPAEKAKPEKAPKVEKPSRVKVTQPNPNLEVWVNKTTINQPNLRKQMGLSL